MGKHFSSMSLCPLLPAFSLLFFPIIFLLLALTCYVRFLSRLLLVLKQHFNYKDVNFLACVRWQFYLRFSWCHCFLDTCTHQKNSSLILGEFEVPCGYFWMIHSSWIHNRGKKAFFPPLVLSITLINICSKIPGVYFAQDWKMTAGMLKSCHFENT